MPDTAPLSLPGSSRRALLLGHLSTVGDIEVLDWAKARLARLGLPYDVAAYAEMMRGADPTWVDARRVDPSLYSHLIVVCGPLAHSQFEQEADIFARFAHCTWIGLNLTMVAPLGQFQPFDVLLERDSDRLARPDLSFTQALGPVPVLGLCLAGKQREYGPRRMLDEAHQALRALAASRPAAVVELDTKWPAPRNQNGLRSPEEFESLLARMDVLLTTRLHGVALALKNGVPVVALDAIRGGGKVLPQARALGWPEVFAADAVSEADLVAALDRCLAPGARDRAFACAQSARETLASLEAEFAQALTAPPGPRAMPLAPRWRSFVDRLRRPRRS
ncbi:MAG TPA: polysaccharide pyruvyl transferase family protein [Rubellimicrobium sp.]|nr:polysaccharide pyruvyl transferase family protein [Rubellimicrobium sp.]